MTETAPPANSSADPPLSASVAVVTYERPTFVARCLEQLLVQTHPPVEIIVVDSSTSDDTARLVRERFPTVAYEVCPAGRGATATARNISYRLATGDVLAFIDDDAFAERDWLENLLAQFADPTVGGVGGRQIRKQPGELVEGVDAIGLLLEDGTLTGNFAADPGRSLPVDHLLGANMAFRRSVIESLGGIRDGYAGTCIREETDLCLRVAHAGYRLTYTPAAVVEHVAAPYAKGERFDLRYAYWAQKNHLILLVRNFGLGAPIVRAYLRTSFRDAAQDCSHRLRAATAKASGRDGRGALRAFGGAATRTAVVLAASVSGLIGGARLAGDDRRVR
jgi:GT2 family glycosyltransferase